jgi:hypothetical protein
MSRILVVGAILSLVLVGCGGGGGSGTQLDSRVVGVWLLSSMQVGDQATDCPGQLLHHGISSTCKAGTHKFSGDGSVTYSGESAVWSTSGGALTVDPGDGHAMHYPLQFSSDGKTMTWAIPRITNGTSYVQKLIHTRLDLDSRVLGTWRLAGMQVGGQATDCPGSLTYQGTSMGCGNTTYTFGADGTMTTSSAGGSDMFWSTSGGIVTMGSPGEQESWRLEFSDSSSMGWVREEAQSGVPYTVRLVLAR